MTLASDKTLKSQAPIENSSTKETDLAIYQASLVFNGTDMNVPFNALTIVEFKRPMRDDYDEKENPITQVLDYIVLLRAGKAKARTGRPISGYMESIKKKKNCAIQKILGANSFRSKKIVESLGEINNQILYISKAISKSNYLVESAERRIDLGDFIAEYVYRVARKIYGAKIKFVVEDKFSDRLILKTKTLLFTSIIENFTGNAIKAQATELTINITNNENHYEVIFSDNGIGLSPEISDIDRIFEFGVTTTSGAGLGLYYVKQYIEQLNRAVLVKPNKIRGLSFILSWNK